MSLTKEEKAKVAALAWRIDDIWPLLTQEERDNFKEWWHYKAFDNPLFRELWYEVTTAAAEHRRREQERKEEKNG